MILCALLPPGKGGWIGSWSPSIGDKSAVGWLTVVLYFTATLLSLLVALNRRGNLPAFEKRFWWFLSAMLFLLGINKQLDIQTAFTELGRIMAAGEGWYEYRHYVQRLFILGVGLSAIVIAILLLILMRRAPAATQLTVVGAVLLMAFVLIRASSFHHVDYFIRSTYWGLRGNWIIEVGGILVIIVGACWRSYSARKARAQALAKEGDFS